MDDKISNSSDFMADKYLSFLIHGQRYAFSIKTVKEIISVQHITSVPEFPEYAKGVINVRGDVIPVIDLRVMFGFPETQYTAKTCIIIINYTDSYVGYIVDNVSDVAELPQNKISPTPQISYKKTRYVSGVGKDGNDIIILIDTEKLVTKEMIEELKPKK